MAGLNEWRRIHAPTQCTANIGSNQIAGNTATCTIPGNTLAAGNTYGFKLEIVDSATAPEDTVSAASSTWSSLRNLPLLPRQQYQSQT